MTPSKIHVEVAYALPDKQKIISLDVKAGTTAMETVRLSKITEFFPELDIESSKMGMFGQAFGTKGLLDVTEHVLEEGDRIEIYRPLIADPKEARRQRAAKSKEHKP